MSRNKRTQLPPVAESKVGSTARALTRAACQVGESVGATHLCTFTETGLTTRLVARHRSPIRS